MQSPPDALCDEGRPPVPAEGALCLADEVGMALWVVLLRGAGGGHRVRVLLGLPAGVLHPRREPDTDGVLSHLGT